MIRVVGVSKRIGRAQVLSNVSIEVDSGSVAALVGPNGSGKTMLMRLIAGLVLPSEGFIEVDGRRLGRDGDFPPSLGMMLEGPAFLDGYTGLRNLLMLASIRNVARECQVRESIEAVGLDPDDRRRYRAYSLGMKQRLGIAAALMEEPSTILLDEPTNALDSQGVGLVLDLVRRARDRGATVILASHDEKVVSSTADVVWRLAEGHLEGVGRECRESRGENGFARSGFGVGGKGGRAGGDGDGGE